MARTTIDNHLKRAGVKQARQPTLGEIDLQGAEAAYRAGDSWATIAARLDVGPGTVGRLLKRRGVKMRTRTRGNQAFVTLSGTYRRCLTRRGSSTPESSIRYPQARTPEARQVHQLHHRAILDPRRRAALPASRSIAVGLNMDPQPHIVFDAEHGHIRQADQQRSHARRVQFHEGSRF